MTFDGIRPIDCDVHPALPGLKTLLPYLDAHWREVVVQRGVHELNSISYPDNAPITARADWRQRGKRPGTDLAHLQSAALAPYDTQIAICNCLYGVQLLFSEDMAAAFARALNQWMAEEWLDRDARLRASIVVPVQNVEMAVAEIERCAPDRRFVQVLLLVMGDTLLGKRQHWPIYEAAVRHGLTIGIHAGSSYRHPVTTVGWPSYHTEDYAAQAQGFQSQLASLVCEGVFAKFPALKVVLLESGFTWLPPFLWRLNKSWKGLKLEVPWLDRPPAEIVREHVRFSLQPFDGPSDPAAVEKLMEHMGSDRLLLFSTDYPHWQFDGEAPLPEGLPKNLIRKILLDNPRETYPRLTP